jgi:hypothetical protein
MGLSVSNIYKRIAIEMVLEIGLDGLFSKHMNLKNAFGLGLNLALLKLLVHGGVVVASEDELNSGLRRRRRKFLLPFSE